MFFNFFHIYLVALYLFASTIDAHAYLDPGSSNALLYILVGIVGSFAYFIKGVFYKIFNKNEELQDTKNAEIIIFSEGKNYWLTFKPIVDALINRKQYFRYLTIDIDDPALDIENEYMLSTYMGKGSAAFARINRIKGSLMIATTPNMGTPGYPMPRPAKIKKLVHVFHSISDIAVYNKYSLDHYDIVIVLNDFVTPSIRKVESLRGLQKKDCLPLGLPYYDELLRNIVPRTTQNKRPTILIAPSWGKKGFLSTIGCEFILKLAKSDVDIIFRPHPQSLLTETDLMNKVFDDMKKYINITIDLNPDGSSALNQADLLVSDKSSIRFDFAFLYERPAITIELMLPADIEKYEWADIGKNWADTVQNRLGPVIVKNDLDNINEIVIKALEFPLADIKSLKDECIANQGYSGEKIADWAISVVSKEVENAI